MAIALQLSRSEPSHVQIEKQLRHQIQSGKLQPGQRLPTNIELARMWGVGCTAVQKALASLTLAGFVARAPRRGTYVQPQTTTTTIAVLFGPSLSDETAHYYRAIHKALRLQIDELSWTCHVYDGLSRGADAGPTHYTQVHQQLNGDLHNYKFKGLIEFSPDLEMSRELEAKTKLPRAVWHPTQEQTDFKLDLYDFARDSVRFLAQKGCKRIAYIRTVWHESPHNDDLDGFLDTIHELGLPQPQIEQVILKTQGTLHDEEIAMRLQQLVHGWQSTAERPDALLVRDDILMRSLALAMIRCGVRVPEDMTAVSFSTEGVNLQYGIPVVRYEFSSTEIARQLVELLWKRIQGETLPALPIVTRGRIKEAI